MPRYLPELPGEKYPPPWFEAVSPPPSPWIPPKYEPPGYEAPPPVDLFYGPYANPGQIPPDLLRRFDYEPFMLPQEDGEPVLRYRLIPKAQMTPYQQWQTQQAGQAGAPPSAFDRFVSQGGWDFIVFRDASGQEQWEQLGRTGTTEADQARQARLDQLNEEQMMWERQQAEAQLQQAGQPPPISEYQRGQLALGQGQLDLERQQYAAQLATQPKSWLEYAQFTGQPAAIQPFMMPLMPEQYSQLQPGQPIPGQQFAGGIPPWMAGGQPGGLPAGGTTGLGGGISGVDALMAEHPLGSRGAYPGFPQGIPPELTGGPLDYADYLKMGQGDEMSQLYATDLLRRQWELFPETKPKVGPGLYPSAIGARPETAERYAQAQTAAESGDPLLGSLSSREKIDMVNDMIRSGWDRTEAERYMFGGAKTFRPYKAIPEVTPREPTREPTRIPTREPRVEIPSQREPTQREPAPKKKKYEYYRPELRRGTPWIPRDMDVRLHEGEAVIPATDNPWYSVGSRERVDERLKEEPRTSSIDRFRAMVLRGRERAQPSETRKPREPQRQISVERPQPLYDPRYFSQEVLPSFEAETPKPLHDPRYFQQRITPTLEKQPSEWIGPPLSQPAPTLGVQPSEWVGPPLSQRVPTFEKQPSEWIGPPLSQREPGEQTPAGLQPQPSWMGHFLGYRPDLPLGGMPALTRPSRQYQARMGPTALQQYGAYAQARTGITPEELQFRLRSMAPPGGGYSGLRWMR